MFLESAKIYTKSSKDIYKQQHLLENAVNQKI